MSKIFGKVVSIIDQKTVKVSVDYTYAHEKYKKIVKRTKKMLCHDAYEIVKFIGQKVCIIQGRPISKLKTWHIIDNHISCYDKIDETCDAESSDECCGSGNCSN